MRTGLQGPDALLGLERVLGGRVDPTGQPVQRRRRRHRRAAAGPRMRGTTVWEPEPARRRSVGGWMRVRRRVRESAGEAILTTIRQ
jgi:hypothetical protein